MGKDKLRRFEAIKSFDNVHEPVRDQLFKNTGQWNKNVFMNSGKLVLELGCGKGEYSVGLGELFPENNYIGVDLKGNRIYIGAKQAIEKGLDNVAFLRTRIDFIDDYFAKDEVDEIWLTFSDPQPNKPRKRLTSTLFIDRYRKFLKPGGLIHLKTDSDLLYESTIEEIENNKYCLLDNKPDLYAFLEQEEGHADHAVFSIKTHYEKLFVNRGHKIKYCCFTIN
ncbi:MAG: tRNA (guanosine(46)-N7)-methyltransferase TrmB [Crocinitomicaceae bacterium]|nr:tRNA (guanosine(46)-N7)-methyltransferase TrmB [Crocinitomicaceae bacterium]